MTKRQKSLKIKSLFIVIVLVVLNSTGYIVGASAKTENPFETAKSITTGTYTGKLAKSNPVDRYKIQAESGEESA